ncbi:PAS domain-containing protein [Kordiimonas sp.]|uniref:PAS domain-containing protein n=1 Tax=Kordiimonas sp. TaxID=1970157 RepID=UPI003A93675B
MHSLAPLPAKLQIFYEVWSKVRDGNQGEIPFRHQLQIKHLYSLASNMLVYCRLPDRDLQVTMSGTAFDEKYGRNLTGMNIQHMATPRAAKAFIAFNGPLLEYPTAGYTCDTLVTKSGKRLRDEYLMLPLQDKNGKRTVCAMVFETQSVSYGLPPEGKHTHATYDELQVARHIDIGYGIPGCDCPILRENNAVNSEVKKSNPIVS